MFSSTLATVAILACSLSQVSAVERGLAWATDDRWAPKIGSLPKITWYHHWQDGPVKQMPSKNIFVPLFWGPSKWDKWNTRKAEMAKNKPKYLLAFNEPDVPSQANMDPYYAADVYMKEIVPWGRQGVKIGSPAIAWDINWMDKFLKQIWSKGGWADFLQIHWYGSHNDLAGFKKFVTSVRTKFNHDIWITELGVTSSSNPTEQQAKNFMMQAFAWLDTQTYVKRAAWFGCFAVAPDSYASGKNALLKSSNNPGDLKDAAFWYGFSTVPDRRDVAFSSSDIHARHARIAANMAREEVEQRDNAADAIDCDEICKLRQGAIAAWEADGSKELKKPATTA